MNEFDNAPRGDSSAAPPREAVVLVHGLWTGNWVWALLRFHLSHAGWKPQAFAYPSVHNTLRQNASLLAEFVRALDAPVVHFVGHSLGGLVICRALLDHADRRPGRVVMLGSPFLDSFSGRRLTALAPGRALLGRSVAEWLADRPQEWNLPHELGVIAGSLPLGLGRLVAPRLPRPNDGVVAVDETLVPGARDHRVLPVSHSGMLVAPRVAREIAAFLRDGRFLREAPAALAA